MIPYNQSFELPELEAPKDTDQNIKRIYQELNRLQAQVVALKAENYRIKNEMEHLTHLIRNRD